MSDAVPSSDALGATPPRLVLRPGFEPARAYLAFFRAGPGSLHPRLLAEDPQRNWDVCVNWWSKPAHALTADIECYEGLNKFEGFAAFAREASFLSRYRYVLLLDDDVLFEPGDISKFFTICDRHELYVAQPALKVGTWINHVVTARNPFSEVRRTSFVEVMAPAFSARALRELLPTFELTRSTLGIDLAWASLLHDRDLLRIVDAVGVQHTKPVDWAGGTWYRRLEALGVDFRAESMMIRREYPQFDTPRTLRGGHVPRAGWPSSLAASLVDPADAAIRFRYEAIASLRRWRARLMGRPDPAAAFDMPEDPATPASQGVGRD